MDPFDSQKYGAVFGPLIPTDLLGELGPGKPNVAARDRLSKLQLESALAPHALVDRDMAECCISALWLGNNFLDQSHAISQRIDTASGSYWHGIMHRREPDFSNAKYWFRRLGDHPIFPALSEGSRQIMADLENRDSRRNLLPQQPWDPFLFVDLCQQALRGDGAAAELCREVTKIEWQLLFDYCYRQAIGQREAPAT